MKFKKWMIIPGIALGIILVFFLSYGITFKNIEAMNATNEMNRMIEKITVSNVEIRSVVVGETTSISYRIIFKLPSEISKKDIEKNVGFSLKFKNQPKEIYNKEITKVINYFSEIEESKPPKYAVEFTLVPVSQKKEDIDLLMQNKDSNIDFVLHNQDAIVTNIPLK